MTKTLYIVNPASDVPTYFNAEVYAAWGLEPAASIGDLAITTVAGLAPDDFEIRLCDESISPADLDASPDFVAITGKISQYRRMRTLAREFRERGTKVLIGGPFASLSPEIVADDCDVLVTGEIEEIADELFSDLRQGTYRHDYTGTRPSLEITRPGRWDLYPNHRARVGTVQTSRGCPFECEFCDVIEYLGRKQRHKPIASVIEELDDLYRLGYRAIFLADDNLTASRGRAKELLAALGAWNQALTEGNMVFATQLSIDAAKDDELMRLCAEAGLTLVFIGIETPSEEALRETKKPQNMGVDLAAQVQRFYDHGISVYGGMIVGFDADGADIFRRQYEFATAAAIPFVSLGALVAPPSTRLYDRMKAEDRLVQQDDEIDAVPWATNIRPAQMTREELTDGVRWLGNKLYHPDEFGERAVRFIERLGPRVDPAARNPSPERRPPARSVDLDGRKVLRKLMRLGPAEASMVNRVLAATDEKPFALEQVIAILLQYAQVRHVYDHGLFWEPHLSAEMAPA